MVKISSCSVQDVLGRKFFIVQGFDSVSYRAILECLWSGVDWAPQKSKSNQKIPYYDHLYWTNNGNQNELGYRMILVTDYIYHTPKSLLQSIKTEMVNFPAFTHRIGIKKDLITLRLINVRINKHLNS